MSLATFKKDDLVIVRVGKDKGTVGVIKKVMDNGKLIVEGVNLRKKTVKANPQQNEKGGFKTIEGTIDRSNVSHYNKETKKYVKIGVKTLENGDRVRYDKQTSEVID